ncbi:MAG: beta-hydroxyacyl-ACP dehydratase [Verrucomicrobiota bacterium]|nr:beta-hydroxyacyl-ACP dehydratase [Verrucomicrobiota bacterium]
METPSTRSQLSSLPHRPPFVFVRQINHCEPGRSAECSARFARDDPMFAGHFPGNPLVPGVILAEALAQTAGIAAASGFPGGEQPLFLLSAIRGMKFFAAVRPEEEIILHVEKLAQVGDLWQFKAEASVAGNVVAAGQLVLNLASQKSSAAME